MAAPVWVLSVDLQTKSATFASGMAEAAKTARGTFNEIKTGSGEMGGHINTNMFASRHAIMAVSEAFGDTMPRAITALIVHLGPMGSILTAAFPYAAIGLAAVLLLEHMKKLREEAEKQALEQERFGTAVQNSYNTLDEKMLQAEIRSDELKNDHLGALRHDLELIDKQSMDELAQTFSGLAKISDEFFKGLQSHWYTTGIGSEGAKHALDEFQAKYADLLAKGEGKGAADLLRGTRDSAEKVLSAMERIKASTANMGGAAPADNTAAMHAHYADLETMHQAGVSATKDEITAQHNLLDLLNAQMGAEGKIADFSKKQGSNATTQTGNEAASMRAAGEKAHIAAVLQMNESALAAERAAATSRLEIQRADIAARLDSDVAFADKDYQIKMAANQAETAALDRAAKDHTNQLRAMQDKALELERAHTTAVSELRSRAALETSQKVLRDQEQSLREGIDATDKGSSARLASISAAIKTEETLHLQDTTFYRELLTQRVQTVREAAEEESKLRAEAGKLAAEDEMRVGELTLAAAREHQALLDSARRITLQMQIAEETAAANALFALKQKALAQEEAALDKTGKDYANKLKAIQNQERQLTQAHENEITAIKDKAEMERNQKQQAALTKLEDSFATGFTQVLMGHKSFASTMNSIGDEVVSGMLHTALMSMMTADLDKERQAAAAARQMFLAGSKFPFPANIVAAPTLAAAAFASVMAFEGGTDSVPGVGRGDVVPARLSPGEGVVPGGVMDGLRSMARSGTMGGGTHYHAPITYAPVIQAVDATGVHKMLDKHGEVFQRHVETTLRKLNR